MNTLHVISHTHWDREWYRTYQQFRIKLVHLVDGVLDLLTSGPQFRYFMLDGQTIVLDDYLQIRPENEGTLRHFVNTGRLTIGPWHILPDEFLVSPEATIRNLLEGARTCRRFGPRMRIGYIPDPFGHIGQMPQILKGFGIHAACVQRGLADEPCEFHWQSPDGSQVFMAYLRDGYGNAAGLPMSDPEQFAAEARRLRDSLIPHSAGTHLLLMLGTDHMEPPPETVRMIESARGKLDGDIIVHSSLADYITAIQASVNLQALPVVIGELRQCKRSHLLPGVLSTRMWIKQRNRFCENLLEKWTEPFSTFATQAALKKPIGVLRSPESIIHQAWRLLMENHPHDSICGCSIDQVHDEMKVRFDQVEQIGEEISRQSLDSLAHSVETPDLPAIIVFNPTATQRKDLVEATVESTAPFELLDVNDQIIPYQTLGVGSQELVNMLIKPSELRSLYMAIHDGQVMNMSIQGLKIQRQGSLVRLEAQLIEQGMVNVNVWKESVKEIEALMDDPAVERFHVIACSVDKTRLVFTADVPGLGWQTYHLQPRPIEVRAPEEIRPAMRLLIPLLRIPLLQKIASRPKKDRPPYQIENEFFLVTAESDGTLTIVDKRNNAVFQNHNCFQDGGDCGDEYNYCPPSSDKICTARLQSVHAVHNTLQQKLRLELEMLIPTGLTADRGSRTREKIKSHITSTVLLTPGVPRIEIHTEVENLARDHRLRVHFPVPFACRSGLFDGHFEIVERPIEQPVFDNSWVEHPRPEVPQRAFTAITTGSMGLIIANRGLPEVETLRHPSGNTEIALTLLRCVGWLSREFANRKGHAGPAMETPGAQMLGKWDFDYAIIPTARDGIKDYHQAYAYETPLRATSTGPHSGNLPANGSFIAVTPDDFIISAVKVSEDGKGWLVRGYNISDQEISVKIHPWRHFPHAERTDLAEDPQQTLNPDREGAVDLMVRGHEIATIRFWN